MSAHNSITNHLRRSEVICLREPPRVEEGIRLDVPAMDGGGLKRRIDAQRYGISWKGGSVSRDWYVSVQCIKTFGWDTITQ